MRAKRISVEILYRNLHCNGTNWLYKKITNKYLVIVCVCVFFSCFTNLLLQVQMLLGWSMFANMWSVAVDSSIFNMCLYKFASFPNRLTLISTMYMYNHCKFLSDCYFIAKCLLNIFCFAISNSSLINPYVITLNHQNASPNSYVLYKITQLRIRNKN